VAELIRMKQAVQLARLRAKDRLVRWPGLLLQGAILLILFLLTFDIS
jgi:hypothetical protein